jgi:GNAT superfamily N-acetyltransferase
VNPSVRDYREVIERVYERDAVRVHPDIGFLSRILSGRSSFLRQGRVRAFCLPGEAFAVAFVDPRVQERHGAGIGSIGFFEAATQDAALAVLEPASEWLSANGVREVWAPFNANPFYGVGLREDRFGEPPFVGCAHQPSTYCSYLEVAGFARMTGYLNFEIDLPGDRWRSRTADIAGVGFRNASRLRFRDEIARFMSLHNDAFVEVWGEAVVSPEEAVQVMARARLAVEPSLFQFAVIDGVDVGMVLCMANVHEVIAPQRAPLTSPSGVWKMARSRRKARSVGLLSVGVQPEHQSRGIGTALVARACGAAERLGFERLEYALVAESNTASRSTAARFGGKLCRRFGVYRKEL